MDTKLNVRDGKLYFGNELVGESKNKPGFAQYAFDNEPLGSGANGITYGVTHKLLGVRQVVKIYFPKENETDILMKAKEESIKNANTTLTGIIAVTFDAGEYNFPCRIWYSVMESVTSYATIKEWRQKRNLFFKSNEDRFDIAKAQCRSSIHTSLNLAAGILRAVIGLYENGVIHGDLNPGNILWILEDNLDMVLKTDSSYTYSILGELNPYTVKLIDMGASKANDLEEAGILRDSYKLYEHMKSLLSPLFNKSKIRFDDWLNFEIFDEKELIPYGVEKICGVKNKNGKILYIKPQWLAGDFFRLICVLTIALGFISNSAERDKKSIVLDIRDKKDFYLLMYGENIVDFIVALSYESMITLGKIGKMDSKGVLIDWEKVWETYPFNIIDINPIDA